MRGSSISQITHTLYRGVARDLFWEGINFDQSALPHNDKVSFENWGNLNIINIMHRSGN